MTESPAPTVSVVIPTRNEELYLHLCLDSVVLFDFPKERLEVIVVDGDSTDRTRQIVQEYAEQHPYIRLLDNPSRIIPRAMNIGVRDSTGDVIVRLDAHATYAPDYVSRSVELLESTGAANVGSVQTPVGTNTWTEVVAAAMASRFGMGQPAYRFTTGSQWAETAWLGAWKRSTLVEAGGFDEEWVVNQDYELNARLRRRGGKILVSSDLQTQYFVRTTPRGLARQYFRYGMWRVKTLTAYPESVKVRQLTPPALVVGLLCTAILLPRSPLPLAALGGLYLVAVLVAAVATAMATATATAKGPRHTPYLLFVYPLLHLAWGTGFVFGLLRFGIRETFRRNHKRGDL